MHTILPYNTGHLQCLQLTDSTLVGDFLSQDTLYLYDRDHKILAKKLFRLLRW